jgi:hypothetical protein
VIFIPNNIEFVIEPNRYNETNKLVEIMILNLNSQKRRTLSFFNFELSYYQTEIESTVLNNFFNLSIYKMNLNLTI